MADSPNCGIPYVPPGIIDVPTAVNDSINVIDALMQCAVLDMDLTSPPGSPVDGELHIVGAGATGAWASQDDNLARYVTEGAFWQFFESGTRVRLVLNLDDGGMYFWDGSSGWTAVTIGGAAVSSVNGQTGAVVIKEDNLVASIATYTASQAGLITDKVVQMDVASANDYTVPANASVAYPVGYSIEVWQLGAGQTTIVADSGVTILYHASNTLKLKGQNSGCSLRKVATNTWRLIGDMEPV